MTIHEINYQIARLDIRSQRELFQLVGEQFATHAVDQESRDGCNSRHAQALGQVASNLKSCNRILLPYS